MHCRPVISIDGMHLYGKFKDKMLIATEIDAENRIFSLAYAIVDEELTASWIRRLEEVAGGSKR